MTCLGWGIVGPGEIAHVFAESLAASQVGRVVQVCGRDHARAQAFCARHGGSATVSIGELLDDPDVHAVYIASPHPAHAATAKLALESDRAVLCEKPMTVSPATTRELCELAERRGAVLLEGWMYRHHPQITRLIELVRAGAIGAPRRLRAWFGFEAPFDPDSRLFAADRGGGAIFDVGGYPLSLATLLGNTLAPTIVRVAGTLAPTGVEWNAEIELDLGDGCHADLSVSIRQRSGCGAVIDGSAGRIVADDPFLPGGARHGRVANLRIEPGDGPARDERIESRHDCYALQAAAVADLVQGRDPAAHFVSHAESIALAHLQAEWRERVGAAPVTDFA